MLVKPSASVSSSSPLTEQSRCCSPECLTQVYLAGEPVTPLTTINTADKPLKPSSECAWEARGL